jgi:hypothetical protein
MRPTGRRLLAAVAIGGAAIVTNPAAAQKRYDPGASDTEIRIGNIVPYSGPASAYGVVGKTIAAYFNKVNAEGSPATRARAISTLSICCATIRTARLPFFIRTTISVKTT